VCVRARACRGSLSGRAARLGGVERNAGRDSEARCGRRQVRERGKREKEGSRQTDRQRGDTEREREVMEKEKK
jgi:hypothetical protein